MAIPKDREHLFKEIKIGNRTAPNRIALNAMECNDADKEGNPTERTHKRYRKAVEGNAGVIVIEAISVIDESRGRLNQLIGMPANQKGLGEADRRFEEGEQEAAPLYPAHPLGGAERAAVLTAGCA